MHILQMAPCVSHKWCLAYPANNEYDIFPYSLEVSFDHSWLSVCLGPLYLTMLP
jgi:hypothetical protein